MTSVTDEAPKPVTRYQDIPGWFNPVDKLLFDVLLDAEPDRTGVLIELGAYLGRSAVVIADHRRHDERFVVVDLFGSDEDLTDNREDSANRLENSRSYKTLSQERFEENFLALHPELPEVVKGLSSVVVEHVEPGTARFAHVDASHMYDKVAEDIANVRRLLMPGGVVVLDDFRAAHTPGVAAATWEAVSDGLRPIAITERKFYGTWDDPAPYRDSVQRAVDADPRLRIDEQPLRDETLLRVVVTREAIAADRAERERKRAAAEAKKNKAAEAERKAQQARADAEAKAQKEAERARARAHARAAEAARRAAEPMPKRIARDWAPPAVVRWARERRKARGTG